MLPWEHSHADQEETQNIGSRKKKYKEQKMAQLGASNQY